MNSVEEKMLANTANLIDKVLGPVAKNESQSALEQWPNGMNPCPFCGFTHSAYEAHIKKYGGDSTWHDFGPGLIENNLSIFAGRWYVYCESCGAVVLFFDANTEEQARDLWNGKNRD